MEGGVPDRRIMRVGCRLRSQVDDGRRNGAGLCAGEAKPGQMQSALQSLDGLGNCLALTHSFMSDEIVAHLHCDSPEYLRAAIADNVSKSAAVARVTLLTVIKEQ